MKPLPERKSPRLKDFDYTQSGAYFVTICTHLRQHIFGHVHEDNMILSDAGEIAQSRWLVLPEHHKDIELDAFIIMPNHMHGIIIIHGEPSPSPTQKQLTPKSLGTAVGSYKSSATRHIRKALPEFAHETIWQTRYHDHIIRNEADFTRIRTYVEYNPSTWQEDIFYDS
ncbi:MAG: transposase [Chloroflexota bacterium]